MTSDDALVFGAGIRRALPLVGRATEARAESAFSALGAPDAALRLVAAPDVTCELKVALGPGWSRVWLARPTGTLESHVLAPGTSVWGVRLRPGVTVSPRAVEAAMRSRAFADLARAPRTDDRTLEASRTIEHVLAVARIDERVALALDAAHDGRAGTVEALAELLRATPRHVGRLFAEALGLAPKRVLSVLRVRRALGIARARPASSWAAIAAEAGYADQSHLGRAFRALLGQSPDAFLRAHGSVDGQRGSRLGSAASSGQAHE